jgi:hypothetical protein
MDGERGMGAEHTNLGRPQDKHYQSLFLLPYHGQRKDQTHCKAKQANCQRAKERDTKERSNGMTITIPAWLLYGVGAIILGTFRFYVALFLALRDVARRGRRKKWR